MLVEGYDMAILEQMVQQAGVRDTSPLDAIDKALQRVFSNPQEETKLQKARNIMDTSLAGVPDEDLEVYLTEFQHLIDGWFDRFEQDVFNGATLKQVLGQS